MVRKNNNKGYVLTEVLVVTVVVMAAFLAIYVNYYPMLGEYERRVAYTNLEPKYSLFYMKKLYLTSYNNENILNEFRSNNNLKYLNLLKTEGNKLVCKDNYVDDLVSCNSLIEYHGIKQLIVSEYNIDDLKNLSIEKNFDKYIDYLPSYKYVNDKKLFRLTIETDAGYATTEFDLLRTRKSLYAVLEDAAYDGTYAKKYTGSHQDSMDPNKSIKDIYYWYGSNSTNGTAILNKNNVIFANHCWQMIRTTDTGGVRMIYNGEAVDGKCLNTRSAHVGYGGSRSSQSLNGTYWYGTDYAYDSSTSKFSISGTTSSTQVTNINGSTVIPTLVGKYTCKSTTESGTCSTLYLIESYNSSYNAYAIPINSSSHYSQFGTLSFNANGDSLAYVGYMYNTVYPIKSKNYGYTIYEIDVSRINYLSYYYSDTISYDSVTNTYTLTNPIAISTLSDYNEIIGKYMGNTSPQSSMYYVVAEDGSGAHCKQLKNGDLATSLMIGNSYTDNGNNTYTVNNATSVSYVDWYNSDSTTLATYKGKYVCAGTSATCSNLMHITSNTVNKKLFYYYSTKNMYQYSESVSYSNGTYTLTGDIKTIWDLNISTNLSYLSTHHYTCLSNTSTCTTVNYIHYYTAGLYYVQLTGVSDIATALTSMLTASNVNVKNSTIKTGIDAWYKKYLLPYDSYIDDTIYCNDRIISSLGAFNPNGGSITSSLQFKENNVGRDLNCTNVTDKFSVSNSSAQLTYKVGLMSSPEMNLLNQANARKTGQTYWLVSPRFSSVSVSERSVYVDGNWGTTVTDVNNSIGARPAVSLIPGMRYSSGDGSMANPYVVITDEPSFNN